MNNDDRSFLDRNAGMLGLGALGLTGVNALQNKLQGSTINYNLNNIKQLDQNQLAQAGVINNHARALDNHEDTMAFTRGLAENPTEGLSREASDKIEELLGMAGDKIVDWVGD